MSKKISTAGRGGFRHLSVGLAAAVALLTASAGLAACSSSSSSPTADGTITVGTDSTYAPNEFIAPDGKTVVGMDVEIFDAVVKKIDPKLKVKWVPAQFGDIIPGLESGKYDIGVSSFTINSDRLKQVNMVSYFNSPIQWVVAKGNPDHVSIASPCGITVSVQKDTVEVPDLQKKLAACKATGKPTKDPDIQQDQGVATSDLASGKAQAMLADLPISVYAVSKSQGKLELLGEPYGKAPYGFAISKDNKDFANQVAKGVKAIMADGTYAKILAKWGNQKGTITPAEVKVQ